MVRAARADAPDDAVVVVAELELSALLDPGGAVAAARAALRPTVAGRESAAPGADAGAAPGAAPDPAVVIVAARVLSEAGLSDEAKAALAEARAASPNDRRLARAAREAGVP